MIAQQFVEVFDEKVSALGIYFSHPFDVTEKKTFGDESRQRCMIDR